MTRSLFTLICRNSDLFGPHIKDYSLCQELSFIGAMLQPIEQCPEDVVIKQGDLSSSIFFCLKGRLSVQIINHFNEDVEVLPELSQYNIFGEIAYTLKTPRTATITCIDYVSLM